MAARIIISFRGVPTAHDLAVREDAYDKMEAGGELAKASVADVEQWLADRGVSAYVHPWNEQTGHHSLYH